MDRVAKNPCIQILALVCIFTTALILVFLTFGGCSKTVEPPNRFSELLGLLPAFLKDTEKPFFLVDYASFRQDNDISLSNREDYIDTMIEDPVGRELLAVGAFITGNGKYCITSTIQDKYVGYNLTDVDAEIQVYDLIVYFLAAIGRFDPQATEDALSNQSEWPSWAKDSYTTENYGGITLHSWGDALKINDENKLSPPHLDELGRALPLAVSDKYLFNSIGLKELKWMINASQDKSDSMADVPEFAAVTNGMYDLGAYALILGRDTLANGKPEYVMVDKGPKLKKFTFFGTGIGRDEQGIYTALVIVHESSEDAEENVSLLKQRIESCSSAHYQKTWNDMITDTDIHDEGRVLLAKLYVESPTNFWLVWLLTEDTLLLHEYE